MKRKTLLWAAFAGVVVVLLSARPILRAQQAVADGEAAGSGGWLHRPLARMMARRAMEKLNLTADQKRAALAVLRNHAPAIKPLVDKLIQERFALRKQLETPSADESAIRAGSAKVASTEADLAVQKAFLFRDLRAIATPDQLKTIDELQEHAEQRMLKIVDLINDGIADS